jgi:hypothetical protein
MNVARVAPHGRLTMDRRDDARTEELDNLRLALATFALHLDAFEMRISERPPGLERGNIDWSSIKSAGSKLDT